ncbi:MAG: flagellar biosynthetic protein FliR [Parvularcula sp.]
MEALASIPIPADVQVIVTTAGLIVLRLSMLIFLLPSIGDAAVNTRTRIAILMALSLALFPVVVPEQQARVADGDFIQLAAFEALVGVGLGFAFRFFVFALMIGGTVMAQAMSLSQIFGSGANSDPNPAVALLLLSAGAALFVTLDFHVRAVGLFVESYQLFPIGNVPDTGALAEWATGRAAVMFALGISLALPFVLINFIYNVVLGLINQAMPQMMVTFIGVPANVLAGLFILVMALSAILMAWVQQLDTAFKGFW